MIPTRPFAISYRVCATGCPSSGAYERYKREGAICGAFGSIRLFWRAALHSDSVGLAAGGALARVSDGGRIEMILSNRKQPSLSISFFTLRTRKVNRAKRFSEVGACRSSTAYLPSHWDSVSCARCSADASRTSSVAVGLGLLLAVAQDMSWGGRASAAIRGSGIVRKPAGRSSLSHAVGDDDGDGDDDDDIRSSVGNKEDFLARYSVTSRLVVSATFAFHYRTLWHMSQPTNVSPWGGD